ncbi:unnamed protein product, partial [Mycena citricolor]
HFIFPSLTFGSMEAEELLLEHRIHFTALLKAITQQWDEVFPEEAPTQGRQGGVGTEGCPFGTVFASVGPFGWLNSAFALNRCALLFSGGLWGSGIGTACHSARCDWHCSKGL